MVRPGFGPGVSHPWWHPVVESAQALRRHLPPRGSGHPGGGFPPPPLGVIATLVHTVGFTRETYRTEAGQLLGQFVLAAWYTAFLAALGLERPDPKRYAYPPLEQAAEAVYPNSSLSPEEVRDMVVAVVGVMAILGDWEALDELAAAAIQTFHDPPG